MVQASENDGASEGDEAASKTEGESSGEEASTDADASTGEGAGLTVNSADEAPKVESAAPETQGVAWVESPPGFDDAAESKAAQAKSLEKKVAEMKEQIANVDE